MSEKRDGTFMVGIAGVGVKPLVKLWRGGQRVQQQHTTDEQTAERQPAPSEERLGQ